MLPDLPSLKNRFGKKLTERMRTLSRQKLGPLSKARQSQVFEGDKFVTVRPDGTHHQMKFQTIESAITVKKEDLPVRDPAELLEKIDSAANEMGKKQLEMSLGTIADECGKDGGTFFRGDGELTPEKIFSVLDKMWIDFDDDDEPRMPDVICGPGAAERVGEVNQMIQDDPKLQKILEEIIKRKRTEFHARQARRQLVG